jgi:hypothetical protein
MKQFLQEIRTLVMLVFNHLVSRAIGPSCPEIIDLLFCNLSNSGVLNQRNVRVTVSRRRRKPFIHWPLRRRDMLLTLLFQQGLIYLNGNGIVLTYLMKQTSVCSGR